MDVKPTQHQPAANVKSSPVPPLKSETAKNIPAAMVLSAVGDAIGFRRGLWEFNLSSASIHKEVVEMGGVETLVVNKKDFCVSDDTIMHMATARALIRSITPVSQISNIRTILCEEYVTCWAQMEGRGAGNACAKAIPHLRKNFSAPFSESGGGCGAAMRTMCLGMVLWKPEQESQLVAIAAESSRMTNNHPTGIFGGVLSAVFSAYAMRGLPVLEWGFEFFNHAYPLAVSFLEFSSPPELWKRYTNDPTTLAYFREQWTKSLDQRGLNKEKPTHVIFPRHFTEDPLVREAFYKAPGFSFSGWPGSSGHDSTIMAYDALLACHGDWVRFLESAALHGGDSDTTAAIGGAWFGLLNGYNSVPKCHVRDLEFGAHLLELGNKLEALLR